MNITEFFDELKKYKFSTGDIFAIIAYTTVDVRKATKAQLKKFVPGFRIILVKLKEYNDHIDRLLDIESEPEF